MADNQILQVKGNNFNRNQRTTKNKNMNEIIAVDSIKQNFRKTVKNVKISAFLVASYSSVHNDDDDDVTKFYVIH